MEFSNTYSIDRLINELASEFPQYTIFDITRPKPKFHEKNGWWLGVMASALIGAGFTLYQFMNGSS